MRVLIIVFAISSQMYAQGQEITISGKVQDKNGLSLPGVSVVVKGTTIGAATGIDGNFTINVKMGSVLLFSSIGYKAQEITIVDSQEVNVVLETDLESLDEIVVVGYGVQKKKLVTGATSQIKGDQIQKVNTVSVTDALKSHTTGVQIVKMSGQPGSGFKVTIRGIGTTGDASPLYVVDGIPVDNIDFLNSSDIKSIDILKDAASAAIYGSRAANGVVLVTTSTGEFNQKATFSYDGYYGIQNVYKNLSLLNATEYAMIMDEASINGGGSAFDFASMVPNWTDIESGKFNGTNFLDEMTNKNAVIQNHSFGVNGGSESSNYSFGFSCTSQDGILGKPATPHYERYNARVNSEHVVLKNNDSDLFKIGEKIVYSYSESAGIGIGDIYSNSIRDALTANPFIPMYDSNGEYHKSIAWNTAESNPVALMDVTQGSQNFKSHQLIASAYVIVNPIKDLVFKSSFGYDLSFYSSRGSVPEYDLSSLNFANNNSVNQEMGGGYGYTFENTLNYKFAIDDSKFDVLIGNTIQRSGLGENIFGSNINNEFDGFKYAYLDNTPTIVLGSTLLGGGTWGKSSLLSYFGRLNYNYKEKYMLTLVMRADGSSNFAKNNRWGYFPSIASGWLLSEESFLSSTRDYLDYLKLRVSWGQNGNQNIDPFQYLSTIAFDANTYSSSKTTPLIGAYPDVIANKDVTWETSEQINIGIDSKFFDSKLVLNFDWYKKLTKDWLVVAPILSSNGANAPFINGGEIKNTGVEIAVTWRDKIGDLSYNISANVSKNKNEVTKIANEEKIIEGPNDVLAQGTDELFRAEVGFPIGYFRGFETGGIFQNQAQINAYKNSEGTVIQPNATPGDVIYIDKNDDAIIDNSDKVMLGDPNPDYTFGINIGLEYKGFDFSVSANGTAGNQIAKSYRSYIDKPKQNYTTNILGRWHGEGTSNTIPRVSLSQNDNGKVSDRFIEDGDYLRISNISIGYDFKRLLKSIPADKIRFYISIQNLYTFTNYSGMDPEIGYDGGLGFGSGIDLGFYPTPRTIMFGTNIKF